LEAKAAVAFEVASHCRVIFTSVFSLRKRVFGEGKITQVKNEGIKKGY